MDDAFEELLCDVLGADCIAKYRHKQPVGYVDLMIAFESRKRSCSPHKTTPLNIALPYSLVDFYRKFKGKDVSLRPKCVCWYVAYLNALCHMCIIILYYIILEVSVSFRVFALNSLYQLSVTYLAMISNSNNKTKESLSTNASVPTEHQIFI